MRFIKTAAVVLAVITAGSALAQSTFRIAIGVDARVALQTPF